MKNKQCIVGYIVSLVLACVGFGSSSFGKQLPQYSITSLNLMAEVTTATGLNNLGEVVGWYTYQGRSQAFFYSNGNFTLIVPGRYLSNHAYGINDSGQVVGKYQIETGQIYPFLYSDEVNTDLGALGDQPQWISSSSAYAINNAGQVVGASQIHASGSQQHAVSFWQENVVDIGALQGGYSSSCAYAINDNFHNGTFGQIVGETDSPYGKQAFLYTENEMININKGMCSTFGNSRATDVNNNDQVVGYCAQGNKGPYVAFLYDARYGNHTLIGNGGNSDMVAINDNGEVVGTDTNGTKSFPFLFINGVEYNLYDLIPANSGLTNIKPVAINNRGQILANADQAAILLTPINNEEKE